jgi:hypothetical protein
VPASHFTLCVTASALSQVTVVPAVTVRVAGANAKSWIVMTCDAAGAWLAAGLAAPGAATLAAGLAGAVVGLAAPAHAASVMLAAIARAVIRARGMGVSSSSKRGGGRQPGPRPPARVLHLGTPATRLPVSEAVA